MIVAPSSRREFENLQSFYDGEIAPFLRAREDTRQVALMHGGLILIATGFASLAIYFFGPFATANFQFAGFAAISGFGAAAWRVNKTRADIAGALLARICEWLGFEYRASMQRPKIL